MTCLKLSDGDRREHSRLVEQATCAAKLQYNCDARTFPVCNRTASQFATHFFHLAIGCGIGFKCLKHKAPPRVALNYHCPEQWKQRKCQKMDTAPMCELRASLGTRNL
ncbi:unnamed protein product [Ixodes pacificus]